MKRLSAWLPGIRPNRTRIFRENASFRAGRKNRRFLLSWKHLALACLVPGLAAVADGIAVEIDADTVVAKAKRADLMGINIAVYDSPTRFRKAMEGPLADIGSGLFRMPGGRVADKFYWNGNGVIVDGEPDPSKFHSPYWKVDYSGYKPGFILNEKDWSKVAAPVVPLDAKTIHQITCARPGRTNLVSINVGSGTPEMAAEWVRWANIKNKWNIRYWELGNELNGSWETGHARPDGSKMTAEKYAQLYRSFSKAMKAVDPTIKIGGPSADIDHHDDYFTPLLRDAGECVDFLSFHYYSLRSAIVPEKEVFDGLDHLEPVMEKLKGLVETHQPERKDKIEYCISEWNSMLPPSRYGYRLINGLWFSAWIGEMMKQGVDSATVWSMSSGPDVGGHGLFIARGDELVPTARYWAFWLWAHCMGDTLVKTSAPENPDLHIYATRGDGTLSVMVVNQSRTNTHSLTLDIDGFDFAGDNREITLSPTEYFWNPYAKQAPGNHGPSFKEISAKNGMAVEIPPYCVKVYQLGVKTVEESPASPANPRPPELHLVLPASEFADMPVEGWVRVVHKGTGRGYTGKIGTPKLTVDGPAKLESQTISMTGPVGRFVLNSTGPGKVTVRVEADGLSVKKSVDFKPVKLDNLVLWNFESEKINVPAASTYAWSRVKAPKRDGHALKIDLSKKTTESPDNHLFDFRDYPPGTPESRIGGVVFDLYVPEDFDAGQSGAAIQPILQAMGAFWISCGQISLSEKKGQWRTVRLEMENKQFSEMMREALAMLFIMSTKDPLPGAVYLDNVGVLLRPKAETR
jgi:hypothetical protein